MVDTSKNKIDSTFIISDDNAEELITKNRLRDDQQKKKDIAFLKSMKEDRIASMYWKDIEYEERVDNKLKRLEDTESWQITTMPKLE